MASMTQISHTPANSRISRETPLILKRKTLRELAGFEAKLVNLQ
jgi:hypothetical protein